MSTVTITVEVIDKRNIGASPMDESDKKRFPFHFFFGYSLGPNIVDPILTLVLPISICNYQKDVILSNIYVAQGAELVI